MALWQDNEALLQALAIYFGASYLLSVAVVRFSGRNELTRLLCRHIWLFPFVPFYLLLAGGTRLAAITRHALRALFYFLCGRRMPRRTRISYLNYGRYYGR